MTAAGAIAVRMVEVSKQYRLGEHFHPYRTLRDSIASGASALLSPRSLLRRRPGGSEPFWALRSVSCEIPRGASVGLIGRNGSGKSTLLKILAQVTEPTAGFAQVRGRVGSLLEVGAGFHQELSGRENVLFNGAVLGMSRSEILHRFDEIVAFAEVERFIDTPVKRYSSGMYLRLAFAVAAHLQSEILLIDEVLAVGDAVFQKKCLGKIDDVTRQGRTVVFVSHNIEAVQRLCSHAVLLDGGRVRAFGATPAVIDEYLSYEGHRPGPDRWIDMSGLTRVGTGETRFRAVRYTSGNSALGGRAYSKGPLEFYLEIDSDAPRDIGTLSVFLTDQYGHKVLNADTLQIDRVIALNRGRNLVKLRIDAVYLVAGVYRVGLWVADPIKGQWDTGAYDFIDGAFDLELIHANMSTELPSGAMVACDFDVEHLE